MNALSSMLIAGLALASAQASAHPPGAPGSSHHPRRPQVPQPIAPSALPYEAYRYGDDDPYSTDRDRYGDDTRGPCIPRNAPQGDPESAPSETSGTSASDASNPDTAANAIDWCALAPYEPRYAPQIPAAWWWHHRTPWRYGRTR